MHSGLIACEPALQLALFFYALLRSLSTILICLDFFLFYFQLAAHPCSCISTERSVYLSAKKAEAREHARASRRAHAACPKHTQDVGGLRCDHKYGAISSSRRRFRFFFFSPSDVGDILYFVICAASCMYVPKCCPSETCSC